MPTTNGANNPPGMTPLGPLEMLAFPDMFGVVPKELQGYHSHIVNFLRSRAELFQSMIDPRRDIENECGYPKYELPPSEYQDLYDHYPIPHRVCALMPEECWQVSPTVYEQEKEKKTAFEDAWDNLSLQLYGEESLYQDEEGSGIWTDLHRADEISGIGRYGIILILTDDGKDLSQPAKKKSGDTASAKLLGLRTFPETYATIAEVETDTASPRFGQPTFYEVIFGDPYQQTGIVSGSKTSATVHWSRVVHIAENVSTNRVYASPVMRPALPPVLDSRKLYGGSAEMYWRG